MQRPAGMAPQVPFSADQVICHEGDLYAVFCLLGEGMVSLELESQEHVLRVQLPDMYSPVARRAGT